METFNFDSNNEWTLKKLESGFKRGYISAGSPEEAAAKASKKIGGKSAIYIRDTGSPGKSGWFQAYKKYSDSLTSVGERFHIY